MDSVHRKQRFGSAGFGAEQNGNGGRMYRLAGMG